VALWAVHQRTRQLAEEGLTTARPVWRSTRAADALEVGSPSAWAPTGCPAGRPALFAERQGARQELDSGDLRLLYWAAFEGVLFDGRRVIHPAAFPGMRDRTFTVGDTWEWRMIAWRVAWVVAPGSW
jgi:hypothetical protein